MAKDQEINTDLFSKTEEEAQADLADLEKGNIRPTGVGLREGEIQALDGMGAQLGEILDTKPVARNALIRLAVREFIKAVRAEPDGIRKLAEEYFSTPDKPKPDIKY